MCCEIDVLPIHMGMNYSLKAYCDPTRIGNVDNENEVEPNGKMNILKDNKGKWNVNTDLGK